MIAKLPSLIAMRSQVMRYLRKSSQDQIRFLRINLRGKNWPMHGQHSPRTGQPCLRKEKGSKTKSGSHETIPRPLCERGFLTLFLTPTAGKDYSTRASGALRSRMNKDINQGGIPHTQVPSGPTTSHHRQILRPLSRRRHPIRRQLMCQLRGTAPVCGDGHQGGQGWRTS